MISLALAATLFVQVAPTFKIEIVSREKPFTVILTQSTIPFAIDWSSDCKEWHELDRRERIDGDMSVILWQDSWIGRRSFYRIRPLKIRQDL